MTASVLHHYEATQAAQPQPPSDWLADLRRRAMVAFQRTGFPTTRDEAWKYTSLQALERRRFAPAPAPRLDASFLERTLAAAGPRLVFVNGRLAPELSRGHDAGGVRVSGLAPAATAAPERLREALGANIDMSAHPFAALNTAFLDDGACIVLDRGSHLDAPIHLVFVSAAVEQEALVTPRVLVDAGADARAIVVEHHLSAGQAANFTTAVTEITAAPGASIEHYCLVEPAASDFHIGGLHARLDRGSRLVVRTLSAGGRLARRDLACALAGVDSEVVLDGLFLAGTRTHTDQHLLVEHVVPRTRSRIDYRGIADAHGRGVFGGRVVVARDAQSTDAHLSSRNLLLAPQAEIDARPELEIHADDVKCSHGATVGQLDASALFYLRTRGIDEARARALLTFAFAHEIVARCALEPVRRRFAAALMGAIPGAPGLEEPA